MDFLSRINAVIHHSNPDKVPFASYDELIPRGEFERELRNKGIGLVLRRPTIWSVTPNVFIEKRTEGNITYTIYHTPKGNIREGHLQHSGRLYLDEAGFCVEGMIKSVEDYDPVIFMLEDTEFRVDNSVYFDTIRDLGNDGLYNEFSAVCTPYGNTRYIFGGSCGFDRWIYEQTDNPRHFARLLQALEKREELRIKLVADSPAEYVRLGDIDGSWGPKVVRRYDLPFIKKWVPYLKSKGKICSVHAHAINLSAFKDLIAEMGFDIVEAFTPPPVGNLSLKEARATWGKDTVIWVNFPETVFYLGPEETKKYTIELLSSDPPGNRLVIGFTEMGLWGASDSKTEQLFKEGFLAIIEAIDEFGNYPIEKSSLWKP